MDGRFNFNCLMLNRLIVFDNGQMIKCSTDWWN